MRILFMDDNPDRHAHHRKVIGGAANPPEVVYTWGVFDTIQELDKGERFDVVSLDHDLGGFQMVRPGEDTGYAVARHISLMPVDRRPKQAVIHSWNPSGARAMQAVLEGVGIPVVLQPFAV